MVSLRCDLLVESAWNAFGWVLQSVAQSYCCACSRLAISSPALCCYVHLQRKLTSTAQSERRTQWSAHRMHAADLRILKVMLRAGFLGLHQVLVHVPNARALARAAAPPWRAWRGWQVWKKYSLFRWAN